MQCPFKTPVDYFTQILLGEYDNINYFKTLLMNHKLKNKKWNEYDNDLHVYPYYKATPALLSVGCPNQCPFCPTAQEHKGKIHFGDPVFIISQYSNENLHFMDENFFHRNDMKTVLALLKKHEIFWLAMSDYKSTMEVLERFGEDYLYECGCRVIEVGLENVVLYKKVKDYIPAKKIVIYYLNMTCLPGETKESIAENRIWMRKGDVSLRHPIHFNNGIWYACGQFYHPYKKQKAPGRSSISGLLARVRPTWIPDTLLEQDYLIENLERANYYSQLVYGMKIYQPPITGSIGEFVGDSQMKATWMLSGLRCGAIK